MAEVKIELGCGTNKAEGYIGIDRYDLPGVDIVADLNKGIPIGDDSVNAVFSSHALEHVADLDFIMQEIYRVCKDEAIVNLLLPYNLTTLNFANHYHKQTINEHTFRFFSHRYDRYTNVDETHFPLQDACWGLAGTDNSVHALDFRCIDMEFFYFEEYQKYDDRLKMLLRRSFLNVCDQALYTLVVCKNSQVIDDVALEDLRRRSREYLKTTEKTYLMRKQYDTSEIQYCPVSLFQIIEESITSVKSAQEILGEEFKKYKLAVGAEQERHNQQFEHYQLEARAEQERHNQELRRYRLEAKAEQERLDQKFEEYKLISEAAREELKRQVSGNEMLIRELSNEISLYNKLVPRNDIATFIKSECPGFIDGIILSGLYKKGSKLYFSKALPADHYIEYSVNNEKRFEDINIYAQCSPGTVLFYEIVAENQIISHGLLEMRSTGMVRVPIVNSKDRFQIRFVIRTPEKFVRICEVNQGIAFNRVKRNKLAYFGRYG